MDYGLPKNLLLFGGVATGFASVIAAPEIAVAQDECGPAVAGEVYCEARYYPGLTYLADSALHIVVEAGAEVAYVPMIPDTRGAISILIRKPASLSTPGDLVLDAKGVSVRSPFLPDGGVALLMTNENGDITVNGGSYTANGPMAGIGVSLEARGTVFVRTEQVNVDSLFSTGILARGRDGVTVEASSTIVRGDVGGVSFNPLDELHLVGGIIAISEAGPVAVTSGDVTTTGRGISAILADAAGDIDLTVNGDVSSQTGYGAYLRAQNGAAVGVDIGSGNTIAGSVSAVQIITEGSVTVNNEGTIRGMAANDGPGYAALGFVASGTSAGAVVNNAGAVLARDAEHVAIRFGDGDDTLNLFTGSTIVGRVLGSGGVDTINLSGALDERSAIQSLGSVEGFERLDASSGYWLLAGGISASDVNVAADATLEFYNRAGADGGISGPGGRRPVFAVEGRVVIDSNDATLYAASPIMSGSGQVEVRSGAQLHVDDEWGLTGALTVGQASRAVITGEHAGDLFIQAGGTALIGASHAIDPDNADGLLVTGSGLTGDVMGDIEADGLLIINRSDAYAYAGTLTGSGELRVTGGGAITLSDPFLFQGVTSVVDGLLNLSDVDTGGVLAVNEGATLNLVGGDARAGGLSGDGRINIDNGSLILATGGQSIFGGVIAGAGGLTLSADSLLRLTGDNLYSGPTSVLDGAMLWVDGSISSDFDVRTGGVLGGHGLLRGDVIIGNGGVFSPGGATGVTRVEGDVTFAPGSTYLFEVDPAQTTDHDLIQITSGQLILAGGTLAVRPAGTVSQYGRRTVYSAITADGGLSGDGFDFISSSAAFLTPHVFYGDNEVSIILVNNNISLGTVGETSNQIRMGNALSGLGAANPLYLAVSVLDDPGVRAAADALSGEALVAWNTSLLQGTSNLRRAISARLADAGKTGVWGEISRSDGEMDIGGDEASSVAADLIAGIDGAVDAWTFGSAFRYSSGDFDSSTRSTGIDSASFEIGAYLASQPGDWRFVLSAAHATHQMDSERQVVLPGFQDLLVGDYDATTTRASAEVAYRGLALNGLAVEPFVGVDVIKLRSDPLEEAGGAAALSVESRAQRVAVGLLGLRVKGDLAVGGGTFSPRGSLAWRVAEGDTTALAVNRFGSGPAFVINGGDLASSAAEVEVGLDWTNGPVTVEAGYRGDLSADSTIHGLVLGATVRF